ncbi:MAG: hypothetical protein AVDCRST_MAG01-01-2291, partial [uncultured Rubrobacteraceae bacterium]
HPFPLSRSALRPGEVPCHAQRHEGRCRGRGQRAGRLEGASLSVAGSGSARAPPARLPV